MVRASAKPPTNLTVKFLCSYGGKIVPRYPDGKLRYLGGETRVLAVGRFISYPELMLKLGELCGKSVSLRCQFPREDLDALVSITSDEDLANLIEEYDHASSSPSSLKIRAFLSPPKAAKTSISHIPLSASSSSSSLSYSKSSSATIAHRCFFPVPQPVKSPLTTRTLMVPRCAYHVRGNPSNVYLIHNGNYWQ